MSDNMDDYWCRYWEEIDWSEEELEMEDRFRYKEWVTKDGKRLKIKDMETSHIKNCLKFVNKEINGKRWCYADEYTKLFEAELRKRGIKEESKADKMFELLGYSKKERCEKIVYIKEDSEIIFNKDLKYIVCEDDYGSWQYITMAELKAINAKVKELGWE